MSGAVKSVKKVFKKVAKTVSKVAPIALGVGALVFTAGSALGALPSWGSAVSSVLGGGGSMLSNVLTGAVTQAGYGSALGMAGSLIGGGSVTKGAQYGALAGAVTGGITGGMGAETDPLKGVFDKNDQLAGGMGEDSLIGRPGGDTLQPPSTVGPLGASAAPSLQPAETGLNGLFSNNQQLIGSTLAGLASGIMTGSEAKDAGKIAKERDEAERDWISNNYGSGTTGVLTAKNVNVDTTRRPTPSERFDPRTYGGQYVFDETLGRIVFVPNQGA